MQTKERQPVRLSDYVRPYFLIPQIELDIRLDSVKTIVRSRMKVIPAKSGEDRDLVLNGEMIELVSVKVNGRELSEADYVLTEKLLTLRGINDESTVEIENTICPEKNLTLEGLYVSGGHLCTQNESEGFRKITYFTDRPDVLSVYRVTMTGDKEKYPTLLCNGNLISEEDGLDGTRRVVWEDPHPKPCYLFALVAGQFGVLEDSFVTASGRKVRLAIYAEHGQENKLSHAMESLKKSMLWDEERFGLECDLDDYKVVAINHFNSGAMENKGLNIFNSQYILADPQTATDRDYENIEGVIGHEYFHNWTGNRVTLCNWFQLTLKEGLTVYRDQEFSSDMQDRAVKRIGDVRILRDYQFAEDAGPNSHPIRPVEYLEMRNFYTATVYNKGAEVIRMIASYLGKDGFRAGMDKYFELYDGQAVACEDFVHAMEKANNIDLSSFMVWYRRKGTPRINVEIEALANNDRLVRLKQDKDGSEDPFDMPCRFAFISKNGPESVRIGEGEAAKEQLIRFNQWNQEFVVSGTSKEAVPSLFRGFSAPAEINYPYTTEELAHLMSYDDDTFNRFDAAGRLALEAVLALIKNANAEEDPVILGAFSKVLNDNSITDSFKAEILNLPSLPRIASYMNPVDFIVARQAREKLLGRIAASNEDSFKDLFKRLSNDGPYVFNPKEVGRRSVRAVALSYVARSDAEWANKEALLQFEKSRNMTEQLSSLGILSLSAGEAFDKALDSFYGRWKSDDLVCGKWLAIQAGAPVEGVLDRVKKLLTHPAYDKTNPNKVRALCGSFGRNLSVFHNPKGEGYRFLADRIIELDQFNPSIASRISTLFSYYPKLEKNNRAAMKSALTVILEAPGLSDDTYEIVSKTINSDSGDPDQS